MTFRCDNCGEEEFDRYAVYHGDDTYCTMCWNTLKTGILAREARYKELGHTGDSMCGCSMCAARADREM